MAPVREVGPDEGSRLVGDGAFLLDVREADEWDAGHAPASAWIPLGELGTRLGELPREATVVVICRTGARSYAAAEALVERGYDAVNLQGGLRAWAARALPVVGADGAPGRVI